MRPKRGRKKVPSSSEPEQEYDKQVYCICQSSKCDTFMIACDYCEEWYHGECINVTPKQAACIQKFFCRACQDENPELKIEFKPNARQSYRSKHKLPSPSIPATKRKGYGDMLSATQLHKRNLKNLKSNQLKHHQAVVSSSAGVENSSEDDFDLGDSQFASPSSSYSQSHGGLYSQRSKRDPLAFNASTDQLESKFQQPWRRLPATARYAEPCGECEKCKITVDCGTCSSCTIPKSTRRRRQNCEYKVKMCLENNPVVQQPWELTTTGGRYPAPCEKCENCKTNTNCGRCVACRGSKYAQGRSKQSCLFRSRMCLCNDPRQQSSKVSPNQSQMSDFEYETHLEDQSPPRRFLPSSQKGRVAIGSKMRRGDHLPGGTAPQGRRVQNRAFDSQSNKRPPYADISFLNPEYVDSYNMPSSYRAEKNGSSRTEESRLLKNASVLGNEDFLELSRVPPDYDSDEDVVLPEMRPCAGPTCSKPAVRSRYCSEDCQLRHESDRVTNVPSLIRFSDKKDKILTPYTLAYPDHLYCRHHRAHNSHAYGVESPAGVQRDNSSISDIYADIYAPFVSSSQSACIDDVYSTMSTSTQIPTSYRRLHGIQSGNTGLSNELLVTYSQENYGTKLTSSGYSCKSTGLDDLQSRVRPNSTDHLVSSRRLHTPIRQQAQKLINSGGNSDTPSNPISLDSITPTVRSISIYNGHLNETPRHYQVSHVDGESITAAELLTADANDLLNVDGNSSTGVGASASSGPSGSVSAFRHGDEYYMMNENENIEINWPTSPDGVASASAGAA